MSEEKNGHQPGDASLDYARDSDERGTSEDDKRAPGTASDSDERGTSEDDKRAPRTASESSPAAEETPTVATVREVAARAAAERATDVAGTNEAGTNEAGTNEAGTNEAGKASARPTAQPAGDKAKGADRPAKDTRAEDTPADDKPEGEDETLLIDGRSFGGKAIAAAAPAPAPRTAPGEAGDQDDESGPGRGDVEAAAQGDPDPGAQADPDAGAELTGYAAPPAGFRGLVAALRVRRAPPTQIMIGVLCVLLGFFGVVQLRLQADDSNLRTARQSDLIRILDDLNDRSERLDSEIRDLETRRNELQSGSDKSKAALSEAEQRRSVLGILAGTVPAKGPGITLRITDPQQKIDAAVLLDTLQELRDAGAEAVQINDVRVVASTDFLDAEPGSVKIDGKVVKAPYLLKVIGDPDTLDPALRIPGGVFAVLDERGAAPTVETRKQIAVEATRPTADLDYARLSDPE